MSTEPINNDIKFVDNETNAVGLETLAHGAVVWGTSISLKNDNAQVPPSFSGADCYIANNFSTQNVPEDGIATRFVSVTSRTDTNNIKQFHKAGENMTLFGSEVF